MSRDNSHGESATPSKHIIVENHVVGIESVSIKTRHEISVLAYDFAKSSVEDCRRYREFCDKAKDVQEKMGHLLNEMQSSVACFVFCVICLEAYINTYAGDRLSELIWEKLELRLRLEDKWIVVPELALRKTFETDKEPYKSLKWLVDQRNFIVHYKGKFSEPEMNDRLGTATDRIFNQFTLEKAERAFQLVKDMIKSVHSFDDSKAPDWLA
ncbi:MAG: hypothetical protein WCD81_01800 [Candidatus Bathyarchaeia archaeon]